jgi:hypothetical protein
MRSPDPENGSPLSIADGDAVPSGDDAGRTLHCKGAGSSPLADHPENAVDVRHSVEALGVVLADRGSDAELELADEVPVLIYVAGGIENGTCGIGR